MHLLLKLALLLGLLNLPVVFLMKSQNENQNVLVPNNDVNFNEKLKTVINGDIEADYEDFLENNISQNMSTSPKIVKLFSKNLLKFNKVNDDVNKNIEENKIDVEDKGSVDYVTDILEINNTTLVNEFVDPLLINITKFDNVTESQKIPELSIINLTSSTSIPVIGNESPVDVTTPNVFENMNIRSNECLLGNADLYLWWVNMDGTLKDDNIMKEGLKKHHDHSYKFKNGTQYDEYLNNQENLSKFKNLNYLSLAYNNLNQLPEEIIDVTKNSLEYLSLTGNKFISLKGKDEDIRTFRFPVMTKLKQLDMRNCRLQILDKPLFENLINLESLFLSHNTIIEILPSSFDLKNLQHLDISYNNHEFNGTELSPTTDPFRDLINGIKLHQLPFKNLNKLQHLDLSYSTIYSTSFIELMFLPSCLKRLSLCYTEIPAFSEMMVNSETNLEWLDISGNQRLATNLNGNFFNLVSNSLEILFLRNAHIESLEWTAPLVNLKVLSLYNNIINTVDSTSFSHMPNLIELDLEMNFLSNWYNRIFAQNQHLKMLNLRKNKLNILSQDMKQDFLNVDILGIGNNEFECSCVLQKFFEDIFEATRKANMINLIEQEEQIIADEVITTSTSRSVNIELVLPNFRTVLRPKYDVISRIYKNYYERVEKSAEILRSKHPEAKLSLMKSISNSFMLQSSQKQDDSKTKLFDYNSKDYHCINATMKIRIPIIDLEDICLEPNNIVSSQPSYLQGSNDKVIIFIISFSTLFILALAIVVSYWKWWYLRYFFMLCKNSMILTFIKDNGQKQSISNGDVNINEENDDLEKNCYDVFVSYCDQNRNWVLDQLLPNIEKRDEIQVCLHERDFQVGYGILENIISCMDRSRCLMLVVSESFLLSKWCQFEMHLAQHRLIETRREKLILVLLEDICNKKQSTTLKYLMKTKTYIKWPADGTNDQKQLFWKRLKKSIISSNWDNDSSYA